MIEIGKKNKLQIRRLSDLGYMLINEDGDDILLHFKEALNEHIPGEDVNVFIYYDKKHRITATEKEVYVTLDEANLLEVKEINYEYGIFLNINTPKDVLYSKDNLPTNQKYWPKVGDFILARLKIKGNTFILKKLSKNEIVALNNNINYAEKEIITSYVHSINEKGITVVSKDLMAIFIPTF